MKTSVNKFDYPTAATATYKLYKQNANKQIDNEAQRMKYREFDKQQRDIERMKVKEQKERKIQLQRRQNKRKLQEQLERKKQELIEIEKMKMMAMEDEKKSHQRAVIRQEQERIQKLQQERKSKQNQQNAQNRFIQALRRLQDQKEINSKKIKEALQRRKIAEQTQKIERNKAIKFRQEAQEKQKATQLQQKRSFRDYKQPLGRIAYNKTIDYTKTFLHNPNIILCANLEDEQNAKDRAEKYNNKQKQKSQQRQLKEQENRKISEERGKKALQKLALERQYQQYLRQQEQKAKLYNLERIEAGKKNQYVGLKPATLLQMEINKKIRGEQQFEQMFFGGQNPEWFDKPTNYYNIVQNKLIEPINSNYNNTINLQKKSQNICSLGSIGAVVSDSHYSFQSERIDDLTSVKKIQNQDQSKIQQRKRVIPLSKPLHQQNHGEYDSGMERKRDELNYSQSQDQQA